MALDEVGSVLGESLDGQRPSLLVVFASPHHLAGFDALLGDLAERFPGALLVGCTGGGIIGGAREIEGGPALSVTAGCLPGVRLEAAVLSPSRWPADPSAEAWRERLGLSEPEPAALMLLPDPFTCDAQTLAEGLDAAYPGAVKFGGLASGGGRPGSNRLVLGQETHRGGAIVVSFAGDLAVDVLVAQGCRPIGQPMVVERSDGNLVQSVSIPSPDGTVARSVTPLEALREVYETLDEDDQSILRHSLFMGLEMETGQVEYQEQDILVRNIVGTDPDSGALAVGAPVEPWQVLRFLLRDAAAARADLEDQLGSWAGDDGARASVRGGLLFSCLGRGEGLFGEPNHDAGLVQRKVFARPGEAPGSALGGFFCNGELGPVGGRTYLHGYTSAVALFREVEAPRDETPEEAPGS